MSVLIRGGRYCHDYPFCCDTQTIAFKDPTRKIQNFDRNGIAKRHPQQIHEFKEGINTLKSMRTFVIIGAGVTGLSTAFHLLKRNAGRVIILEKEKIGSGSSSRAAGISTGLLWTKTGVIARKIALALFAEWSITLPGYHFNNEHGCLNLMSQSGWKQKQTLIPLYDEEKAPYQILSADQITHRWPHLQPPDGFVGLWDPKGGYSEPSQYIEALRHAVTQAGAQIREGIQVKSLSFSKGRVSGVITDQGSISADGVLCTAYAWTNTLLKSLDIQLPAKSFLHQRYVSKPLKGKLDFPPINADDYFGYIRPAEGNRILMGVETPETMEWKVDEPAFTLSQLPDQWNLAVEGQKRFASLFPALKDIEWETAKTGLINFSMDGEPILGRIEEYDGLFVGLSFHSGGFSYSPVSGMLLAELADCGETSISIDGFSPNRYTDKVAIAEYLTIPVPQKSAVRRRH